MCSLVREFRQRFRQPKIKTPANQLLQQLEDIVYEVENEKTKVDELEENISMV